MICTGVILRGRQKEQRNDEQKGRDLKLIDSHEEIEEKGVQDKKGLEDNDTKEKLITYKSQKLSGQKQLDNSNSSKNKLLNPAFFLVSVGVGITGLILYLKKSNKSKHKKVL